MKRMARLFVRSWWINVKILSRWGYFLLATTVSPVIFASIALFMFRAGDRSGSLLYAAVGAGMIGVWNCTLVGSGQALTLLRQQGLLELLVAAPAPFVQVLTPITVATATVGFYSLAATLAGAALLFGVPLHVAHPFLLVLALSAATFSLGLLGVVMASVFVVFRYANAATNLLDYPIYLVAGLLVPISVLPGWIHPLSWLLAPTWAAQAIRTAMLGGQPLPAIGACVALGVLYLGIGVVAVHRFELLARKHASLALA